MYDSEGSAKIIPWRIRLNPLDLDSLASLPLVDEQCEESLKALVQSCIDEASLSFMGQNMAWQHLLELLETRFRLLALWQHAPQIQEQELLPPLFITGLPKTGSTFLHRLLALDPDNRVPRMWEVMHPLPPPSRATYDTDLRIGKAERRLRWLRWMHPDLVKAHPIAARIPHECGPILGYTFQSRVFLDMFSIPSYESWLKGRDMKGPYLFHARFLRHLQWQCPARRWVLKSSDHLLALQTVMKVYPEAKFIFMHRYPLNVLQAACSQMAILKGMFSRDVDRAELGRYERHCLEEKIRKMMEFRDANPEIAARFIDVRYQELATDPVGTVATIYHHFGLPFEGEARARMEAFAAAERGKDRRDSFSLADFNLRADDRAANFDLYCERFGIAKEEL